MMYNCAQINTINTLLFLMLLFPLLRKPITFYLDLARKVRYNSLTSAVFLKLFMEKETHNGRKRQCNFYCSTPWSDAFLFPTPFLCCQRMLTFHFLNCCKFLFSSYSWIYLKEKNEVLFSCSHWFILYCRLLFRYKYKTTFE